jgi:hypothetical protein
LRAIPMPEECPGCGEVVAPNADEVVARMDDGFRTWHTECLGGSRVALTAG